MAPEQSYSKGVPFLLKWYAKESGVRPPDGACPDETSLPGSRLPGTFLNPENLLGSSHVIFSSHETNLQSDLY